MNKILLSTVSAAAALCFVSCQGTDPRAASMNYSDAVTRLDQVDPAYRAYFRDQQGSSYGLDEQRRAIAAAAQTARTPVPTVAANAEDRPLAQRRSSTLSKKRGAARGRIAAKGKSKAPVAKKGIAKGKTPAKSNTKKRSGKAIAANGKKRR